MSRKKETSRLSDIRVLQLIDSLRSGGAERMAISYANALAERIEGSYLCATRKEGLLKAQLSSPVGYLFLNKRTTLDLFAFWKLRKFIKNNKIDLIQAHGTSWFLAVLVKLSLSGVRLIWHDHNGRELENRRPGILKPFSTFFDGIISVNSTLKKWSQENLKVKRVAFFKNFLSTEPGGKGPSLRGENDFKIICVANFRPEKDHLTLLQAFQGLLSLTDRKVSLHLVGKDKKDRYSDQIHQFIRENKLGGVVYVYGEQDAITHLLQQAELGVLSSSFEGLPVALLEYGKAGLPVVCTRVGQCEEVIGDFGILVSKGSVKELTEALRFYLTNDKNKISDGFNFQRKIVSEYTEEAVVPGVIDFFKNIN